MSRSPELMARAREILAQRLSPSLLAHSVSVGKTAASLARRFGVDEADAELAGLLHDIARGEDDAAVLALADEMGLPVLDYEHEHAYVLHGRVGAAVARRDLPGIGEGVLSAIEVHTVGGAPMSDLDRVVYLADMIEPGRTYEGVDDLRVCCATLPLAECFRVGYGRSLRHVLAAGRPVHPVSAAVTAEIERETGRAIFDPPAEAS